MTQSVTITKTLKGRKKGITAEEIADRANLNINSVRPVLWQLKKDGTVFVAGTLPASYGRPANLYRLAS